MNILNSENGTTGLDNLFAEYGQPAEITQPEKPVEPPKENLSVTGAPPVIESDKPVPESIWRNNPAYFQTGKKAGQKRPIKNNTVSVGINPNNEPSTIDGGLISGALFLVIVDLLFPLLITFVHNKYSKKKIKVEDLQLTKEQRKQLEPISDKVVKQIQVTANPTVLLFWTMLGLYGIQYATARMIAKEEQKKQQNPLSVNR
jgi:hypothetical protein